MLPMVEGPAVRSGADHDWDIGVIGAVRMIDPPVSDDSDLRNAIAAEIGIVCGDIQVSASSDAAAMKQTLNDLFLDE